MSDELSVAINSGHGAGDNGGQCVTAPGTRDGDDPNIDTIPPDICSLQLTCFR